MTLLEELNCRGYVILDNFFNDETCLQMRDFATSIEEECDYYDDYRTIDFDSNDSPFGMKPFAEDHVLPRIDFIEGLNYHRSWATVYEFEGVGVPIHGDNSDINVNIWITPDESILDKEKNGLIIYDAMPSEEDTWDSYNRDREYGKRLTEGKPRTIIPYKYNRAVVFLGRQLHKTDGVKTLEGIEHHRINYTFLFNW